MQPCTIHAASVAAKYTPNPRTHLISRSAACKVLEEELVRPDAWKSTCCVRCPMCMHASFHTHRAMLGLGLLAPFRGLALHYFGYLLHCLAKFSHWLHLQGEEQHMGKQPGISITVTRAASSACRTAACSIDARIVQGVELTRNEGRFSVSPQRSCALFA